MSSWLKVTLKIKPPFLTNQQGALRFGLDAQTLHINNRPVILGSLIKGNLKEILEPHIPDIIAKYFGKEEKNSRAELIFSYFWKLDNYSETSYDIRPRIKVGEEGTVGDKMLRFAEVLDTKEPDKLLSFTGYIYTRNPNEDLTKITEYLTKGLKLIPAIGSNKGIGYGAIQGVKIEEIDSKVATNILTEEESTNLNQTILETGKFELCIQPMWPVCFPHTSIENENTIVSKDIIPGEVIKGALAELMSIQNKSDEIKKAFDKMRITQAVYTPVNGKRPLAIPLSTVSFKIKDGTGYSDLAKNNIFKTQFINEETPNFKPDWKAKDFEAIANQKPERVLQVRNAHDSTTRAAKNEKLFSMESLLPHDAMEWRCKISLPKGNAEELLKQLRTALTKGLYPLGKTNAPADIKIKLFDSSQYFNTESLIEDDIILITLQSDTQLFDTNKAKEIPYSNGKQALDKLYKESWSQLSRDSLEYQHSFSQQHVKGGKYWQRHFINKYKKPKQHYQPQIFIKKGSIFSLKIKDLEKAKEHLDKWQDYGIQTPEDVSPHWQDNPWIPENGYAEIHIQKIDQEDEV